MKERYARQIMLPEIGMKGQEKLGCARVLIVGVGGLGSPVALYLSAAGVGTLGIVDNDIVSLSNLQRQILYKERELGYSKSQAASLRINEISSKTTVCEYNTRLNLENAFDIISEYDIVVDCSDNIATRLLIDDVCARQNKPFVYGAIDAYTGQVSVFDARQNWRYIDLFPSATTASTNPNSGQGVIGTLPGIIGSIQATEVIKLITGLGTPLIARLFTIDIRSMESMILTYNS